MLGHLSLWMLLSYAPATLAKRKLAVLAGGTVGVPHSAAGGKHDQEGEQL